MAENVYVFDTNIVSSLLYERQRRLLTRIQHNQTDSLILCEPVIYEIERGLNHKQAENQLRRFRKEIFPMFTIIPVQLTDWRAAAALWAYTKGRGRQLSDIDLLLGAITIRLGGTLVTDDKDFTHLPTVPIENWL